MTASSSGTPPAADSPRASVVVVTKNRAGSLARTLEALRWLDHDDHEVVVVDHSSTDDTAAVAARFGVRRVVCPPERGIAGCRQLGVEEARGDIVAMCDDDCVPVRGWLTGLAAALADPSVGVAGGRVVNHGFPAAMEHKGRSRLVGPNGRLVRAQDPATTEFFGNANLAFRRAAFFAVGGYDTFFHTGAEIDLQQTFRERGFRIVYVPEAAVDHYSTGVSYKRNRWFWGGQLMRLYRHLKHDPPRSAGGWLRFARDEAALLGRDLRRGVRALGSALLRRDRRRLGMATIGLFNAVSARLAVPWLSWKAGRARRPEA